MGFKWRRIAGMLPNRSDDAVRNRWHRLEEARRHNDTTGVAPDTGYEWEGIQRSRVQAAATKARPEAWEAKPNAWDLAGSFSTMAVA